MRTDGSIDQQHVSAAFSDPIAVKGLQMARLKRLLADWPLSVLLPACRWNVLLLRRPSPDGDSDPDEEHISSPEVGTALRGGAGTVRFMFPRSRTAGNRCVVPVGADDYLCFVRSKESYDVSWAGEPVKTEILAPSGKRLSSRGCFETRRDEVGTTGRRYYYRRGHPQLCASRVDQSLLTRPRKCVYEPTMSALPGGELTLRIKKNPGTGEVHRGADRRQCSSVDDYASSSNG